MPAPGSSGRSLTYPEVGASFGELPPGYRQLHVERELGSGDAAFRTAAARLFSWHMHRGAGIHVPAETPVAAIGVDVRLGFGAGPLRAAAWCRVVGVVETPHSRGFAYGTLTGHPECGEEAFVIEQRPDRRVFGRVIAFSRPARWYTELAGPVGHLVQQRVARRYLAALTT